jgi:hypothetical protein
MEETMLDLSEFCHNHHPSGVKLLAKNIRRGFSDQYYRAVIFAATEKTGGNL